MMKCNIIIVFLMAVTAATLSAQQKIVPNKPAMILDSKPGFITINELSIGMGLKVTDVPYAKRFFGFTTINGYQINKNFITGGGTGISFYNGGLLVPLFLDFRYIFNATQITPYVFADGGLLLNFSDIDYTKLFISPGIGFRYSFARNTMATLGTGLLIQSGGSTRDSFIMLKAGITYKL